MEEWSEKLEPYWLTLERREELHGSMTRAIQRSSQFYALMREEVSKNLQIDIDEHSFRLKFEQDYSKNIELSGRITERILNELAVIKERLNVETFTVKTALSKIEEKVPLEEWATALVEVGQNSDFDRVAGELQAMGFMPPENDVVVYEEESDKFRLFNLIEICFPPDTDLLKPVTALDQVTMIYDAQRHVSLPNPIILPGDADIELKQSRPVLFPNGESLPPDLLEPLGNNVAVCVIDTGIDSNHPDLQGRVKGQKNFSSDEDLTDEHGHGTHCAGIIGGSGISSNGEIVGIAPGVTFLSAKALNRYGSGNTAGILSAIRWGIENGADIISMSLGTPGITDGRSILSKACDRAVEKGCVVCVSAGNDGPEAGTISIPGDASKVLTVGAIENEKRIAYFSSRGPTEAPAFTGQKPTVIAPGVNIVSAKAEKSNHPPASGLLSDYTTMSGTSMSCPHMAGAAAVILSYFRKLANGSPSPQDVIQTITEHCVPIEGAEENEQGKGLLNVPRALWALKEKFGGENGPEEEIIETESAEKLPGQPIDNPGVLVLGRDAGHPYRPDGKDVLSIGNIEPDATPDFPAGAGVFLDNLSPHVAFICGKRGSGKSYTMGVLVEELARSGLDVGIVVIDPMGVFYSLKYENSEPEETGRLHKAGIEPTGFENVTVMVPVGAPEDFKAFADEEFSIGISDLSYEDWCYLFEIKPNRPQGQLIQSAILKVRSGYIPFGVEPETKVSGKERYDLDDIITCIQSDRDFRSKEDGYAVHTRRSIIQRFTDAREWGLFSTEGTPLPKISRSRWVTVVDVSAVGEGLRALVVGVLCRKILAARQILTRTKSWQDPDAIPVTWLMVDEAHLMAPGTGKTIASRPLIEYVKQGRQPGCGLILATQRPSATTQEVLSQVDLVIAHTLTLSDDIEALMRILPATVKERNRSDLFLKLPKGVALVADHQNPQSAFQVTIRQRLSYHAGKEASPLKKDEKRQKTQTGHHGQPKHGSSNEPSPDHGKEKIDNLFRRLKKRPILPA